MFSSQIRAGLITNVLLHSFFVSIPSPRWLHYDANDYAAWHSLVVNANDIISHTNGIPIHVIFYKKFIIQEFRMYFEVL